mmetsp:Transcript_266/g.424  ORF Transcript_266/g.424 Transcript_266/m.424 type:complete len:296 (-) Transcript_266:1568-2455(-)
MATSTSFKVRIKTLTNEEHLVGPCESDMTIAEFKALTSCYLGVPADEIRCIFWGKRLEDRRTLRHYGIDAAEFDRRTVHIVLRMVVRPQQEVGPQGDAGGSLARATSLNGRRREKKKNSDRLGVYSGSLMRTNIYSFTTRRYRQNIFSTESPLSNLFETTISQLLQQRYPNALRTSGEYELDSDIRVDKCFLDQELTRIKTYIRDYFGENELKCTRVAVLCHTPEEQTHARWMYKDSKGEITSVHTDSSYITLNVCMSSSQFHGSDIIFERGLFESDKSSEHVVTERFRQQPGKA